MNSTAPYLKMALNNAWANATLYAAVQSLPEGAFSAPAPGFFDSLQRTLNHIYEVDLYYLDALEAGGRGRTVYDRTDVETPTDLAQAQADVDLRLARFCKDLTEDQLPLERLTERQDGIAFETVEALLLHLFQHQIHHRGQAHVQLQHLGAEPPQLDEFHLDYDRAPTAQAYFK